VPIEPKLRLKVLGTDSSPQRIRVVQQMGNLPFMCFYNDQINQFYRASINEAVENGQL
jgi:hypothetical protein